MISSEISPGITLRIHPDVSAKIAARISAGIEIAFSPGISPGALDSISEFSEKPREKKTEGLSMLKQSQ